MGDGGGWLDNIAKTLRSKVSADKKRFQQGGFDLDLTYITDRILAMSYPADGVESTYRNSTDEVANMLKTYHNEKFLIFNLSERKYDPAKFDHSVRHVPFPDHHAPSLPLLLQTCHEIDRWLWSDPEAVVVVHCLAGKGRTGTVIAAYLIYCGLFDNASEAMDFFAYRRSLNNWGVTGPSQRRSVQYLAEIITNKRVLNFDPVVLSSIRIEGMPRSDSDPQSGPIPSPFFVLYNNNDPLNPTKGHDTRYGRGVTVSGADGEGGGGNGEGAGSGGEGKEGKGEEVKVGGVVVYEIGEVMQGDVLVHWMYSPLKFLGFHDQLIGRFSFYTGMLPSFSSLSKKNRISLEFHQCDIDEVNGVTDGRYPPDFKIVLEFEPCPPPSPSSSPFSQTTPWRIKKFGEGAGGESDGEKEEQDEEDMMHSRILSLRAFEPRDGSVCFLKTERTYHRIEESRELVRGEGKGGGSHMGGYLVFQQGIGGGEGEGEVKRRWVVLKGDRISYYKGPRNLKALGEISVWGVEKVKRVEDDPKAFELVESGGAITRAVAGNEEEREAWMKAIGRMKEARAGLLDPTLDLEKVLGSLYVNVSELCVSKAMVEYALGPKRGNDGGEGKVAPPPRANLPVVSSLSVVCEVEIGGQKQKTPVLTIPISSSSSPTSASTSSSSSSGLLSPPCYFPSSSLPSPKLNNSTGSSSSSEEFPFKFLIFDTNSTVIFRVIQVPGSGADDFDDSSKSLLLSVTLDARNTLGSGDTFEEVVNFDTNERAQEEKVEDEEQNGKSSLQVKMVYMRSQAVKTMSSKPVFEDYKGDESVNDKGESGGLGYHTPQLRRRELSSNFMRASADEEQPDLQFYRIQEPTASKTKMKSLDEDDWKDISDDLNSLKAKESNLAVSGNFQPFTTPNRRGTSPRTPTLAATRAPSTAHMTSSASLTSTTTTRTKIFEDFQIVSDNYSNPRTVPADPERTPDFFFMSSSDTHQKTASTPSSPRSNSPPSVSRLSFPSNFSRLTHFPPLSPFMPGNSIFIQNLNSKLNLRVRKLTGKVEANGKMSSLAKFVIVPQGEGRISLRSQGLIWVFLRVKGGEKGGGVTMDGLGGEQDICSQFYVWSDGGEKVAFESVGCEGVFLGFGEDGAWVGGKGPERKECQFFVCVV